MRARSSSRALSTAFALVIALSTPGCGDDDVVGTDGAGVDGGRPGDGGVRVDAGFSPPPDGSELDSGPGPGVDSGVPDVDSGPGGMDAGGGGTDAGPAPTCGDFTVPALTPTSIGSFRRPVFITSAPGDDALYVVEARGSIMRVTAGGSTTFLNITTTIGAAPTGSSERGLLGLAFHPSYATNGRFFVGYTPTGGTARNCVAEYHRNATDPTVADSAEIARLVDQADPETNHNGGMVTFGPDGRLYAGMGDGGGAGDAHGTYGNALNLTTLLGKILRLDVDASASGYAAAGNPFSGASGLPQIWAYGVRNPWRFSFDRSTGDLYIGDVGQGTIEEIDFQPFTSTGGENYGWRAYEGTRVYSAGDVARVPTHAAPITEYRHDGVGTIINGCSVTGGYVYRGAAIPELSGVYFYSDYCSQKVVALKYCGGALHSPQRVGPLELLGSVVSFGQDSAGELYIVTLEGPIFRIDRM